MKWIKVYMIFGPNNLSNWSQIDKIQVLIKSIPNPFLLIEKNILY